MAEDSLHEDAFHGGQRRYVADLDGNNDGAC